MLCEVLSLDGLDLMWGEVFWVMLKGVYHFNPHVLSAETRTFHFQTGLFIFLSVLIAYVLREDIERFVTNINRFVVSRNRAIYGVILFTANIEAQ